MTRSVASLITGRKTKFVIIGFWLVFVALASMLAGKLTDAERNDAKTWLPGSAESTQVLDKQAAFLSPDTIPAVIVYERATALTQADQAKVAADAKSFAGITGVDGQVIGPIFAPDGNAAQIIIPLNLG